MKLKKAILWGITAVLLGYFVYHIAKESFKFWLPVTDAISLNDTYQWLFAIAFTIIAVILIGYIVILFRPLKGVFDRTLGVKTRAVKSLVIVKWGGNWFYGWLTGTINCDGKKFYRVTVPSAPIPISAQLILVPRERIMFCSMKKTDYFTQLGSLGFDQIDPNIKFWPPPEDD